MSVELPNTGRSLLTYCDQVDECEDEDQDTRSHHYAPERQSKHVLTVRLLVEITKRVETKDEHDDCKHDEAVSRTQKRPVARKV